MTPEASLVKEIQAYDPKLRMRWARHSQKWLIEHYSPCQDQRLANALPPPDNAPSMRKDLWEGWKEGYLHVLTVPVEMAHWKFIAPELARADSWRQGGWTVVNNRLDKEAELLDQQADRKIDNYVEAATDDAYERLAWLEGRRVAMDGFTVVDRRHG